MAGLCQCGCGQETKPASVTNRGRGWVKGEPLKYIHGHSRRVTHGRYLVDEVTGCWNWQLKTNNGTGYYLDTLHKNEKGRAKYAHRVQYEKKYGKIPAGFHLDHLCRNRACVNPDHLEVVTPAENVRRGEKTKLTFEDVNKIKEMSRRGDKQRAIASVFDVSRHHISDIICNRRWKA